jgi:dTDP-4-dehydrorhamnose reductase
MSHSGEPVRRILITGAEGQLGSRIGRVLGPQAVLLGRHELDITLSGDVHALFDRLRPSMVINCAAYTAVDRAEQDQEHCYAINALAVETLAQACDRCGAMLVQISSDYVFGSDSDRSTPWEETDRPDPQGVYARSKLLGEQAAQTCRRHLVVRTCGLYGTRLKPAQSNFVDTMLRLGAERRKLRVVGDQHCTPTSVSDVAEAILTLVQSEAQGIFHVVNQGQTTWYDFAKTIFGLRRLDVDLERITSAEYGAPAPRPRYSVLSTAKYQALAGQGLPTWEDALRRHLDQLPNSAGRSLDASGG